MDNECLYSAHSDCTIKVSPISPCPENTVPRKFQVWSWPKTKLLNEIPNHSKEITTLFLAPFGGLVTHDEKGNVKMWDPRKGECWSTLYTNNDVVSSRIWQLDGSPTQLIIATNRCESSLLIVLDFDYPNP